MSNLESASMLDKGLEIISLLAQVKRPLRISTIADLLSLPRTTVYRLIASLEQRGFVKRTDTQATYFLSFKFLELGEIVRESLELRALALPFMEKLRDEVNLAVHLVVRDGDEAVYVEKVESNRPVRLFTRVGRRAPLHVTACPRLLLASLPDAEIEEYISCTEMVKYTPTTVADADTLRKSIQEIREKGYSIAWGELEPFTAAIAVPIRDYRREVVASLSLAGPDWYFKSEDLSRFLSRLKFYAAQISQELGYAAD
jgi:IclR family KDG regulon transcriptional repressor